MSALKEKLKVPEEHQVFMKMAAENLRFQTAVHNQWKEQEIASWEDFVFQVHASLNPTSENYGPRHSHGEKGFIGSKMKIEFTDLDDDMSWTKYAMTISLKKASAGKFALKAKFYTGMKSRVSELERNHDVIDEDFVELFHEVLAFEQGEIEKKIEIVTQKTSIITVFVGLFQLKEKKDE